MPFFGYTFLVLLVLLVLMKFGVPQLSAQYAPEDDRPHAKLSFKKYQGVAFLLVLIAIVMWIYYPLMMTLWVIIGLLATLCFCTCAGTRVLSFFPVYRGPVPFSQD